MIFEPAPGKTREETKDAEADGETHWKISRHVERLI
jgi:hypothetical protein